MSLEGSQTNEIQQQPPAKKAGEKSLLDHSGFFDGLKDKAKVLSHAVAQKTHEITTSETAQRLKGQAIETTHNVMASPITHRVVAEATQTGKQVANENVSNVNGAIAAGKRGDLVGVIRHAAPIAGEVALGPGGVVMNVAKNKLTEVAINQAPASQRASLQHASDLTRGISLQHLTLTGLAKTEASSQLHEARKAATNAVLEGHPRTKPTAVEQAQPSGTSSSTPDFLKSLQTRLKQKQTGVGDH